MKKKPTPKRTSQAQEKALFKQLITLLSDIRQPQEMHDFLGSFLSESEQSTLAKRLAILQELSQGKSYEEIKQILGVSSATISSISEIKDSLIIKQGLKKIAFDGQLEKILRNFFS